MPIDLNSPTLAPSDDWGPIKEEIFKNIPEWSTIIDVGCKQGYWQEGANRLMQSALQACPTCGTPTVFKIGIDPIDYRQRQQNGKFNIYIQCVVGLEDGRSIDFYTFNEPGCNSLLPPSDLLLGCRNIEEIIQAPQRRLDSIWEENNLTSVYYIKTDCQGTDLNVIKSLGKYLKDVQYIEMEVGIDQSQPFYKGANTVEEAVKEMEQHGFELIEYNYFPESPLPEGELLFRRKQTE